MLEARYVSQMVFNPHIEVPKADTMPLAAGHKEAGGKHWRFTALIPHIGKP